MRIELHCKPQIGHANWIALYFLTINSWNLQHLSYVVSFNINFLVETLQILRRLRFCSLIYDIGNSVLRYVMRLIRYFVIMLLFTLWRNVYSWKPVKGRRLMYHLQPSEMLIVSYHAHFPQVMSSRAHGLDVVSIYAADYHCWWNSFLPRDALQAIAVLHGVVYLLVRQ